MNKSNAGIKDNNVFMLSDYITPPPSAASYIDGQPLTHAIVPSVPQPLLQQWVEQITLVVTWLHEAGIVWGDAKPDNVLIDASKDAWIIDFGGGYTEGWVDPDLAGTEEGDNQGLYRIVEFLQKSAEATL